jgi:hypothetical protein
MRRIFIGGGGGTVQVVKNINIGQVTKFAVGDSGDSAKGIPTAYNILTTGQYSGTVNLDVAHYAAATISFDAASKEVRDSANGLATVLTGDKIVIWGSASNNAVLTVATGGVAAKAIVTEAIADEAAGAYITILKRASHSNNAVLDLNTNLMWSRYTSKAEKLGIASGGKLTWNDAATSCTLHAAGADMAMSATTKTLKIIGGAAEVGRYKPGTHIVFSGFANAGNNLAGGYRVETVAINGADLDITLWTGFSTTNPLTTEAAGGSRSIKLVTNNIFSYAAAANAAALGGYTDWRVPDDKNLVDIRKMEPPNALPNSTAFPSWPSDDYIWTATTQPSNTSYAVVVDFYTGYLVNRAKTAVYYAALLRGS